MNAQTNSFSTRKAALSMLLFFVALYGLFLPHVTAAAQNPPEPRREQLLNGLRIVLSPRPGDANVLLKMRIHSGAIFDTAGKAGTMALLGDALFPDPATREYFTEELGGRLMVTTDADSVNISLSGRATEFERILEQLRSAIFNFSVTAEGVSKLRDARVKLLRETSIVPAAIADRAIAARLFGDYPLGRSFTGTIDSLARVERSDVIFARERFLNPNNATLVVTGGIDNTRVLRLLRQRLGAWRQSEAIVPPTFRQPAAPDPRTLIVDLPNTDTAEIRLAARSITRSDPNYAAAALLALLARDRWQTAFPQLGKSAFFVRDETHPLPGIFVMGASVPSPAAANALTAARSVLNALATTQPTTVELERVREEALAALNKQFEQPETLADLWLDADTYKLDTLADQIKQLKAVMPVAMQRTAAQLFLSAPLASVAVGSAAQLKTDLERTGRVEVMGAARDATQNKLPPKPPQ
ncbi:MAG: M16 family metallopeptidase [Pyrinomonadaceae bacterium]